MAKPRVPNDPRMSPEVRAFLEDLAEKLAMVHLGSGVPAIKAPQCSIFIRSDGTTTNDRAYINIDGSDGWTAITTVA